MTFDIVVEVELEAVTVRSGIRCLHERGVALGSDRDVFYAIAVVNDVAHYVFFHTRLIEHLLKLSLVNLYIYVYNSVVRKKNGVRRASDSLRTSLEGTEEDHRQYAKQRQRRHFQEFFHTIAPLGSVITVVAY